MVGVRVGVSFEMPKNWGEFLLDAESHYRRSSVDSPWFPVLGSGDFNETLRSERAEKRLDNFDPL